MTAEKEKRQNIEVAQEQELLDTEGCISQQGWARRPAWRYDRSKIFASAWKIKEWDYYAVHSSEGGWTICGTISDLGYASLLSVSFIDYNRRAFAQKDSMKFLTFGRMRLAQSSTEDSTVSYTDEHIRLAFIKKGSRLHVMIAASEMVLPDGSVGLDADFELLRPEGLESMNIATSWEENRRAFYLNEKVNCMPATGRVRMGDKVVKLKENDAWGVLDWGRGRWTRKNTLYWGSGSGLVDGHSFGFNIGYGFTDRTPASENALFYDGRIHKLDDVEFHIPGDSFIKPWKFTSSDGRFEMDFEPAVDRSSNTNLGLVKSVQHQVFGWFSGTAVLDDGLVLHLERFPGFAEKVYNKW